MEETRNSLPENAQRELAPGEEYKPLLGAERKWAEVTPYSVTLGLLMVVIFSAAAAYLGRRVAAELVEAPVSSWSKHPPRPCGKQRYYLKVRIPPR